MTHTNHAPTCALRQPPRVIYSYNWDPVAGRRVTVRLADDDPPILRVTCTCGTDQKKQEETP